MTFAAIVEAIPLFFKFFDELFQIAKMMQKTPEEKRQDVLKAIKDEYEKIQTTGRPTW